MPNKSDSDVSRLIQTATDIAELKEWRKIEVDPLLQSLSDQMKILAEYQIQSKMQRKTVIIALTLVPWGVIFALLAAWSVASPSDVSKMIKLVIELLQSGL